MQNREPIITIRNLGVAYDNVVALEHVNTEIYSDDFIGIMHRVAEEAISDPDMVKSAPHTTPVRRLDETTAAKNPLLKYRDLV